MKDIPAGWGVYMVRCSDGSFYTGITNNFARRLAEHQAGRASRYTRARLPVEPVYWEVALDRSSATRRETAIKTLSRQAKIDLMENGCRQRGQSPFQGPDKSGREAGP
jgi:predicted GIY-YIG superfamily endonuclease